MVSLKDCLSSDFLMASTQEPMRRTPCSSRKPSSPSCMARVRPVCPPSPARRLSGFSFMMMRFTVSGVRGSRYTSSAESVSVMTVAGFELTSTVSTPSASSTRHAWVPA